MTNVGNIAYGVAVSYKFCGKELDRMNGMDWYDGDGQEVFAATYDPWGRQTITKNDISFHRGYCGHEMLPDFGLINMNGRVYDPLLGRFLSPDPYVQDPLNPQCYNRYAYCMNNPVKYTDPSGDSFWAVIGFSSAAFAVGNTLVHSIRGDIHNLNDFGKYFSQGAISGALIGGTWYLGAQTTIGASIAKGLIYANLGIDALALSQMLLFPTLNKWDKAENSLKLVLGKYYLDENSYWKGILQGYLRMTWEAIQTTLGHAFTQITNCYATNPRVDYLGGATFLTVKDNKRGGITIGNYIRIKNDKEITKPFDEYVKETPLYMHEYGHTIDSHWFGISYLTLIGVPSLYSAFRGNRGNHNHDVFWTELRANRNAAHYFEKYYGVTWSDFEIGVEPFPRH